MNPYAIIDKYYKQESDELRNILVVHSECVTEKALAMAHQHPELNLDLDFLREGALLHDIGIFLTDAPGIHCHGSHPYICHGTLGAELLRNEGLPRHALVCERHTGAGISLRSIIEQNLPIPHRDMLPITLEEQLICFADKFFSKSHPDEERSIERARKSLKKFGDEGLVRFDSWCKMFL